MPSSTFDGSENPLSEGGVWETIVNQYPLKKVSGNVLGTSGYNGARHIGAVAADDQYSEVVIASTFLDDPDPHYAGTVVRCTATGSRYEMIGSGTTYPSSFMLQLFINGNWAADLIAETSCGTWAAGDVMRLEAEGTSIRCYRNGSLIGSVTDSYVASGQWGIAVGNKWAGQITSWEGGDLGGAIEQAVGLAEETDAALDVGRQKRLAVGVATETDDAIAAAATKRRSVALADETDAALAVTGRKSRAVAPADETDAALAVTARKARALALAEEIGEALALARTKWRAVGFATETDIALSIVLQGNPLPNVTGSLEAVGLLVGNLESVGQMVGALEEVI